MQFNHNTKCLKALYLVRLRPHNSTEKTQQFPQSAALRLWRKKPLSQNHRQLWAQHQCDRLVMGREMGERGETDGCGGSDIGEVALV